MCAPLNKANSTQFNTIIVKNSSGDPVTVTKVTFPSKSPLRVDDWFVDHTQDGTDVGGVGMPWHPPTRWSAVINAGETDSIAIWVTSTNPGYSGTVRSGVRVRYTQAGDSGTVTAGSDMAVVAHGTKCHSALPN